MQQTSPLVWLVSHCEIGLRVLPNNTAVNVRSGDYVLLIRNNYWERHQMASICPEARALLHVKISPGPCVLSSSLSLLVCGSTKPPIGVFTICLHTSALDDQITYIFLVCWRIGTTSSSRHARNPRKIFMKQHFNVDETLKVVGFGNSKLFMCSWMTSHRCAPWLQP